MQRQITQPGGLHDGATQSDSKDSKDRNKVISALNTNKCR